MNIIKLKVEELQLLEIQEGVLLLILLILAISIIAVFKKKALRKTKFKRVIYFISILFVLCFILLFFTLIFINIETKEKLINLSLQYSEINNNKLENLSNESILKSNALLDETNSVIHEDKVYFRHPKFLSNFIDRGGRWQDIRPDLIFTMSNGDTNANNKNFSGFLSPIVRESFESVQDKYERRSYLELNSTTLESENTSYYKGALIIGGFLIGIFLLTFYIVSCGKVDAYILNIKDNFPDIQEITENTSKVRTYIPNEYLEQFYIENINKCNSISPNFQQKMQFTVYLDRINLKCFIEGVKPKITPPMFKIMPYADIFQIIKSRPNDLIPVRLEEYVGKLPLHYNILNNIYYIDGLEIQKANTDHFYLTKHLYYYSKLYLNPEQPLFRQHEIALRDYVLFPGSRGISYNSSRAHVNYWLGR